VKDAINTVWWLSKTEWPKASNRRVLQPYSPGMTELLAKGYRAMKRPSGHDISENFAIDNGAAQSDRATEHREQRSLSEMSLSG
jgi:site-specific DNA-methyltransferase (cytosine-N4-specific)